MYIYFYTDCGGTKHQILSCQSYECFDDFLREEYPDEADYWERKFGITEDYPYNDFRFYDLDEID